MAASHLAFLTSQAAHIESEVFRIEYPEIQYKDIVPVDTSAPNFAGQITYFSSDGYGQAEYLATHGQDFPFVDTTRDKHDVRIENLGIGYQYNEFELEYAMMLGINLDSENAMIARRVSEEKTDDIVMNGNSALGWDGFINTGLVTPTHTNPFAGSVTGQAMADVINTALSGMEVETKQVEMADTILLPIEAFNTMATRRMDSGTDTSVLEWVKKYNVYTARTGRPLMIRTLRGLEDAGTGKTGQTGLAKTGRMIVYRRHPSVLKLHMPMPLRFYPPQQWMMKYCVMGVFRLGGLEIRKPKAIRYVDGVTNPRP